MKHYYSFILIVLLLSSCASPKFNFVTDISDIKTSAICNAIEIFTKTKPKIYREDSVFYITFTDTIFSLVFKEVSQPNKHKVTHEWMRDTYYEGLGAVNISGSSDFRYFFTPDIQVGLKAKIIPNRFIEKNGKLFLWDDDDYPITEELLAKLHQYNLFLEDTGAVFPDNPVDDSKMGFDYLFCKNDFSKYKIIITNRALGYYNIPKIRCEP